MSDSKTQTELQLEQRIVDLEKKLEDALIMSRDFHLFSKLRDLLATKKFKEADSETTKIILKSLKRNNLEQLSIEDLENYPLDIVGILDRLWKKYSDNHFGFSIQLDKYRELEKKEPSVLKHEDNVITNFVLELGWAENQQNIILKDYNSLDFSMSAPKGALPAQCWMTSWGMKSKKIMLKRLLKYQALSN